MDLILISHEFNPDRYKLKVDYPPY